MPSSVQLTQGTSQQGGVTPTNLIGYVHGVSGPTTYTITDNIPEWEKENEVSRIIKRTNNGYFFVITVDGTDDVWYRVWKGGWFPYMVARIFKRFPADVDGNRSSWNSVTKRSHLPATLGSAYELIDTVITTDRSDIEHERYVKDLLSTKPENLKMIGGLEKLAEGDVDAPEANPNMGSSHNVGGHTYTNIVSVESKATMQAVSASPEGDYVSKTVLALAPDYVHSTSTSISTPVEEMEAKISFMEEEMLKESASAAL